MAAIRTVLTITLAAALAACSPEDAEPPVIASPADGAVSAPGREIGYACESGETVLVRYDGVEVAEVAYKGRAYTMRASASASGARFVGSELEWWTRTREGREEAVLSRVGSSEIGGSVLERCMRPATSRAGAPVLESKVNDVTPCPGPALTLALESSDAGAGNRGHTLALTNSGAAPCTLAGYPEIQLLNAEGDRLPGVRSEQTLGSHFREGQTPPPVDLLPEGRAYFDILSTAVPAAGQETCPQATRVRVTPPRDTAALELDLRIQPCGGRVRVTPLRGVAEP